MYHTYQSTTFNRNAWRQPIALYSTLFSVFFSIFSIKCLICFNSISLFHCDNLIVILIVCLSFACLFIIFKLHLIKISKCCYCCHFFSFAAPDTLNLHLMLSLGIWQCLFCGKSSSIKPSNTLNLLRHNSFTVCFSVYALCFVTLSHAESLFFSVAWFFCSLQFHPLTILMKTHSLSFCSVIFIVLITMSFFSLFFFYCRFCFVCSTTFANYSIVYFITQFSVTQFELAHLSPHRASIIIFFY